MKIVTENEAVATFRTLADMACQTHEPVFIAREGAGTVVLLALDDFESRNDTAYLMASPANAARLMEAVSAYDSKTGYRERELIEP
jgi:antitoxin YefM